MRRVTRGFTLVELLVVIGIIALLISILLPSLAKARQQSLKTQDLSNIRQLAQACIMYAGENKGTWPRGERGLGYAGDDLTWTWQDTFDIMLRFGGGTNKTAADVTVAGKIDPDKMRVMSCNTWLYETAYTDQLGQVGGTGQERKMGWVYFGGRNPTRFDGTLRTYPTGAAAPAADPKYVWPRKMGDRPTTRTLLTCYGYASSPYGTMLPHFKKTYTGQYLANSSQPFLRTSDIQGMSMAYTDGSARFVGYDDFGAVTAYGGGWYFYDRLAN